MITRKNFIFSIASYIYLGASESVDGSLHASEVALAECRTGQDVAADTSDVLAGARAATRATRRGRGLPASAPVHRHNCLAERYTL